MEVKNEFFRTLSCCLESLQLKFVLLQFGSAFFSADTDQSDFDIILCLPKHCTRAQIYSELPNLLESTEAVFAHCIIHAVNPIIKVDFKGKLWIDISVSLVLDLDMPDQSDPHSYLGIDPLI